MSDVKPKSKVKMVRVEPQDDDIRLDKWFKLHYPGMGFGRLSKMLRKGQVRLDGKKVKAGDRITKGQIIRVPPVDDVDKNKSNKPRETKPITEEDIQYIKNMVLYEDDDVVVLNKEPGIAVQGGTGQGRHIDGLLQGLKRPQDVGKPKLVHRLDKDTSGVLLLARTSKAARLLTAAFKTRETEKLYWALLNGVPKKRQGKIDKPMEKMPGSHGEKMMISPEGKRAITYYKVLETAAQQACWMAFQPRTGRTHQLRLHAAVLGNPIVGDGKYGGAEAYMTGLISKDLHLHARSLTFPHPKGGDMTITAPMPPHMKESWDVLDFDERGHENPFSNEF
jgi:23S rRNA pseudouridine955/2504/2580 synthase